MTKPELSVIIVHHQTPELLKLCLKSIISGHRKTKGSCDDHRLDCEIIVVDSTISRKARDLIKDEYPNISYLPFKENLGYSRGVNIGIQNSTGDYILILNPDIIVTEGAIKKLLDYVRKHPDIGMLGPRMLNFNGSIQRTYFSFYQPMTIVARRTFLGRLRPYRKVLGDFLMSDSDPSKIQTPDWLMGSAIMVSRKALEKVGLMDERFFMYFEDVDWARRFWHNNYKIVYYPEAVMYHYHQRESKSRLGLLDALFNKKARWHIRSAIKFFWKYKNLARVAAFNHDRG